MENTIKLHQSTKKSKNRSELILYIIWSFVIWVILILSANLIPFSIVHKINISLLGFIFIVLSLFNFQLYYQIKYFEEYNESFLEYIAKMKITKVLKTSNNPDKTTLILDDGVKLETNKDILFNEGDEIEIPLKYVRVNFIKSNKLADKED